MNGGATGEARITALMGQYAVQMKPWVRFVAVLMFIAGGFMVLAGLLMAMVGSLAGALSRDTPGGLGLGVVGGVVLGGIYLVMSLLYLVPAVFLNRTASACKRMETGDQTSGLEDVLKNQKSFWRFVGILSLILIVLMVLGFILIIGGAILTGLNSIRV